MNELTTELKRPMDKANMGGEDAALSQLVSMLNNPDITGAQVPHDAEVKVPVRAAGVGVIGHGGPMPTLAQQIAENNRIPGVNLIVDDSPAEVVAPPAPILPPTVRKPDNTSKIFFTGVLKVGKDYLAAAAGASTLGFADPIYALATYFFGLEVSPTKGKELPGCREFLQAVGQCGRGIITPAYPMSLGRAAFVQLMRSLGTQNTPGFDPSVDWKNYGLDQDLWVNSCLKRAKEAGGDRVAVTNCRYMNEYQALTADGWTPWHVMCSGPTRDARLAKAGIKPGSSVLIDISEQMALRLNDQVIKKISQEPKGPMLHVVWNDTTPPPSPRLHTVNSFLQALAINEI